METALRDTGVPRSQRLQELVGNPPDFANRCAIRSIFDGRYRFSRYFAPTAFNTPTTVEELVSRNDLELYDLQSDPEETRNLALDAKAQADLIMMLNAKLNERIGDEVGDDDGSFLPIRNGKWYFPSHI
jgi:hypothetical protein